MIVPFVDLKPSNTPALDVLPEIASIVAAGAFTGGPAVADFEERFAIYAAAGYAAGVSSGLDALRLALLAIRPSGDRVVVPAMTFAATYEAIVQAGLKPVPVDVDEHGLIDTAAAAAALSPGCTTILPVHLYGQLADMAAIDRAARAYAGFPVVVLEDAAQALGATRDGYRAGELAHAVAWSFYPTKNLGAWGDAGAATCSWGWIDSRIRELREHGQSVDKTAHLKVGYTARLDAIQAAVLTRKLAYVDELVEQRREVASRYIFALDGVGDLRVLQPPADSDPSWHLFPVRTSDPHGLAAHLRDHGVGTGRHYPMPPPHEPAFLALDRRPLGSFPNAEAIARETLSLPIWPGITEAQVEHVIASVNEWFHHRAPSRG